MQLKTANWQNNDRLNELLLENARLRHLYKLLYIHLFIESEEDDECCELCVHCTNRDDDKHEFDCELDGEPINNFIASCCIPGILKYMERNEFDLEDKDAMRVTWKKLYKEQWKERDHFANARCIKYERR